MTFRIAVVQPISHRPGHDENNIPEAVRHVERSAGEGAHFVCFPETYPGPWRMPAHFDPTAAMAQAAARHKVHVIFGTIEPISEADATAYNLICMAYPDGTVVRYRRTHPNGPWIYTGGPAWEFQYVAGNAFSVFDSVHGKVGLAMCSEVYVPEVTRALALRGAEIIFMPAGTDKNRLWATWRTLIWARAIENLAIVVTTQNLFSHDERGLAMVASPEEILFEFDCGRPHPGRRQPGPGAVSARNPRRAGLRGHVRRQARRARTAMAAAGAPRHHLSQNLSQARFEDRHRD